MKPEYMRGKNAQGLCAWEQCHNPVNPEMLGGFGPLVIGYMCTSCGKEHEKTCKRQAEEIQREWDAIIFRDIWNCIGNKDEQSS